MKGFSVLACLFSALHFSAPSYAFPELCEHYVAKGTGQKPRLSEETIEWLQVISSMSASRETQSQMRQSLMDLLSIKHGQKTRFKIEDILGSGGEAIVFQVRDAKTGQTLAAKTFLDSGAAKKRLKKEKKVHDAIEKSLSKGEVFPLAKLLEL